MDRSAQPGIHQIPPEQATTLISDESRAYWRPVVAAMVPMNGEEIADVAAVIRRIEARTNAERAA